MKKNTDEKRTAKDIRAVLRYMTRASIIAGIYAAVTLAIYPLAFGAVQFRISEVMTLLPLLFPEAIPGLFVGCIVANLFTPNIALLDVIFGSLATLLAAYLTSKIENKWLAPLPPVLINAVVVGFVITFSMAQPGDSFLALFWANMLSVGAGEAVICWFFGVPLMYAFENISDMIKRKKYEREDR